MMLKIFWQRTTSSCLQGLSISRRTLGFDAAMYTTWRRLHYRFFALLGCLFVAITSFVHANEGKDNWIVVPHRLNIDGVRLCRP